MLGCRWHQVLAFSLELEQARPLFLKRLNEEPTLTVFRQYARAEKLLEHAIEADSSSVMAGVFRSDIGRSRLLQGDLDGAQMLVHRAA